MASRLPPLLKEAPFNVLAEFGHRAGRIHLPPNTELFHPGQACSTMYLIIGGKVRVSLPATRGGEVLLYHVQAGQGCVLSAAAIIAGTPFPARSVVERTVSGYSVSAADFKDWVSRHAFWREYSLRLVATRMADLLGRLAGHLSASAGDAAGDAGEPPLPPLSAEVTRGPGLGRATRT